jgi:hypothetical protein
VDTAAGKNSSMTIVFFAFDLDGQINELLLTQHLPEIITESIKVRHSNGHCASKSWTGRNFEWNKSWINHVMEI